MTASASRPIRVIGLGIGQDVLSPDAAAVAAGADLLCAGRRLLARFPDHPGRKLPVGGSMTALAAELDAASRQGLEVVVLADGDPLFFGVGETLLRLLGPGRLEFWPGVGVLPYAAARLGMPWRDLPVVSLHGRSDPEPFFRAVQHHGRAAVLTDPVNTPPVLARALIERGGPDFVFTVLENLGGPDERVQTLPLSEVPDRVYSALNLVLAERSAPPEVRPCLGLPDALLSRDDAVYTKFAVRALALGALRLLPGHVLWDLGAGAGTVSIEASTLLPRGSVVAVERDPGRAALLRRNIRRTGAVSVIPVEGEAPGCLAGLPDPDRVFLGGGLARGGRELLECLRDRLRPGGRVAATAVLLRSLELAREAFGQAGWPVEILLIQASDGVELAGDVRLRAENPVFLICADKPA